MFVRSYVPLLVPPSTHPLFLFVHLSIHFPIIIQYYLYTYTLFVDALYSSFSSLLIYYRIFFLFFYIICYLILFKIYLFFDLINHIIIHIFIHLFIYECVYSFISLFVCLFICLLFFVYSINFNSNNLFNHCSSSNIRLIKLCIDIAIHVITCINYESIDYFVYFILYLFNQILNFIYLLIVL